MANERIYSIKINGVETSIDLIQKLLDKLEDLEKRINALSGKTVSVSGASGGGGSSRSGGADLYDRIEKTQQKINQASDEEYKILLKKKAELKEIEKEQKSIVAGQRAEAQEYANTLNGQRQKLADMKAALGNITIDSADFEKQVQEIDKLNSKIKEIEQSYGQYGRNVGNYANGVAEGLTKVTIKVGETERTFNSAKEASRTLGNELKSMAVNGEQGTKVYKDLDEAFKKLQSTMKDVSASSTMMDNLLDTMQGLTAIGSIGQGFAALFGLDDSEIQKSIQKLVALQNVLQGLETIQKQITTAEGIGGWIAKGNNMVDSFVQSLTGVKTAADTAATGLKTVAVANTAVETTSKAAAVGTKILSASLKAIGVGLVIAGISALISMIEKFIDESKKEEDALKELQDEQNKINVSYKMAKAEITSYRNAVVNFVGTKKEEQAMVAQLNSKYGSALGTYKTLGQWKDILIQKTEAYCEAMKLEAEMAAATKRLENAYLAEMEAKNVEAPWWNIFETDESYRILQTNIAKQNRETAEKAVEDLAAKIHSHSQKAGLFDFSPQIKSGSAKSGETIQQQEQELTRLRIRAMDEGLQKTIAEINYNARKEIDALKLTGARKAEAEVLIEKERQRKVREAQAKDYQERIEARRNFERELSQLESDNLNQRIENLETEGQHAIDALTKNIKIPKDNPIYKLYFDNEHPNRAQTYSINFDLALTGDERAKRLLEDKGNQAQYWINQMGNLKVSPRKANDMLKRLSETNEDDIKKSLSKFDDIAEEYFKTVEKIRNEILDPDEQEEIITDTAKQLTDKFEAAANEIGYSIYGGIRDFQYETRTDLYEDALKQRASYYKLILQQEIDNNNKVYNERVNSIKKLAQLERDELDDAARKQYGGEDNEAIWDVFLLSQQDVNESKEFIDQIASHYGELGESLKKNEITLESFIKEVAKNYGGELGKQFANDKISLEEFRTYFDRFVNDYKEKKEQIDASEKNRLFSLDVEKAKNDSQAITSVYDKTISTIEAMLSSTQQRYSVRMQDESTDAFGIINLSVTKKIAKEAVAEYGLLKDQLEGLLQQIRTKFQNGEITLEDYEKEIGKLQPLWTKAVDGMQGAIANAPDFGDFLRSIMPYVSQLANGLQSILSQVSNLISAEFDAQRQALDDELALLEEKYNAQEELEQRHADKINAIEDEIANARGARRDHLVDMYNEEIAAQRRAFIEKQKIDEEMKRNEEKQKALEKAERKKQNEIQFQQALMSQALAIMNAFATKPFVPVGLAMGSLATGLTAVQLALMKKAMAASEKYADGGIVHGNSHAQGGVKAVVGGQRAVELEGNEFIIRKKTATQNLPLLDYINKSERKLDANDLLEFFKGNQGTKTIRNSFKNKYASGGALPSVSATKTNNIIVVKDESHPVVSVVDIINATDNYNNVRVLAGVES